MGRLLTLMLVACLAFSHGRATAAMPHLDGSHHHHVAQIVVMADDHQFAEGVQDDHSDRNDSGKGPIEETDTNVGQHSHGGADGMALQPQWLTQCACKGDKRLLVDDPALGLLQLDPLMEPPSA